MSLIHPTRPVLTVLTLGAMLLGFTVSEIAVAADARMPSAEDERSFEQREQMFRDYFRTESMLNRLERPVWSDHTKYLWPVVLAILDEGPDHPEYERAIEVMNHGSYEGTWAEERWNKRVKYNREFFHFAGLGMARLLIEFEDLWEPAERRAVLETAVGHGGLRAFTIGTANHRTMSITNSYLVMQEAVKAEIEGARQQMDQAEHHLRQFAQRLYENGMPEWDSSTYYAFTLIGFINVYELAEDEKVREVARAVVDWLTANHALKYTQGVFGGPESRGGSAYRSVNAITDHLAWYWWGDAPIEADDLGGSAAYVGHLLPADFQPDPALKRIARKVMASSIVSYGSRPTTPVADHDNFAKETFYAGPRFSLGAIYERRDGWHYAANQAVPWKLVVRGREGATAFTGAGMTRTHSYTAGRDPWTQWGHDRNVLIQMSLLMPDAQQRDDLENRTGSFLAYPENLEPLERDGVLFFDLDGAYVAARPIRGELKFHEEVSNDRRIVEDQAEEGQVCGFIIEVDDQAESFEAFQEAVLEHTSLDRDRLADDRMVTYTAAGGREIQMQYRVDGWHWEYFTRRDRVEGEGHGRMAQLRVDGRERDLDGTWPIYASRYVYAGDGELRVTDGESGFRVHWVDGQPVREPFNEPRAVETGFEGQFYASP